MSRNIVLTVGALMSLIILFAGGSAATAAERSQINNNPIDWTIITTFRGALGDEIPLRVGQSDFTDVPGLIFPGFGERHIIEAHGQVPSDEVIDEVLQDGHCDSKVFERFTCTLDEAEVVFLRTVDPRSEDGKPFGIISAYFKAPPADD